MKHIGEWQSKSIAELLSLQTDKMVEIVKTLEQALLAMLDGAFDKMEEPANTVSKLEKECDRIKEALAEKLLDEHSTIQFTKTDRHKIIRKVDGVVNHADLIAHEILLYNLKVPSSLVPAIKNLIKYAIESVTELRDAVNDLRRDFKKAIKEATMVEDERREARNICWALLKDLYHTPTDPLTLILTRELILDLTWLADIAESFSDFIEMLALKYSKIK
jgi:predicted phosphate transport protein (TIGR00153 family)